MNYCTGREDCACDDCEEANAEAAALEARFAQDMEIDEEEAVEAGRYRQSRVSERLDEMFEDDPNLPAVNAAYQRRVVEDEERSLPPGELNGYLNVDEYGAHDFVHFAPAPEVAKVKRNYSSWKDNYWQRKP